MALPRFPAVISKRRELNGAELPPAVADWLRVWRGKIPGNRARLTDNDHQPSH